MLLELATLLIDHIRHSRKRQTSSPYKPLFWTKSYHSTHRNNSAFIDLNDSIVIRLQVDLLVYFQTIYPFHFLQNHPK